MVQGIRFDLCWIVCYLARFSSCFDNTHVQAVKNVLRYLKHTSNFQLKISATDISSLKAYVDSDHAGCLETRRSTYGFSMFIGNQLFYWKSKLHNSVVLSSFEAEYIGLSECVREVLSMFNFLKSFSNVSSPIVLCDNLAAISVVDSNGMSKRSKHIDTRYHFFMEHVRNGSIIVKHISGSKNFADLLTKPVGGVVFKNLIKLVLQNIEAVCDWQCSE